MLRLFESLCYADDAEARKVASTMVAAFATDLKALPADKQAAQKGEALQVATALRYLAKFKFIPDDFAPKADLDAIVSANSWEKKK